MEIKVITQDWFETGMEGIDYCLHDPSKEGYAGLIQLEDGDHLTIPGKFKGYIKKVSRNPYGLNWHQDKWIKEEWVLLFFNEHEALYRKKQKSPVIYTPDFEFIL